MRPRLNLSLNPMTTDSQLSIHVKLNSWNQFGANSKDISFNIKLICGSICSLKLHKHKSLCKHSQICPAKLIIVLFFLLCSCGQSAKSFPMMRTQLNVIIRFFCKDFRKAESFQFSKNSRAARQH